MYFQHLGNSASTVKDLISGSHPFNKRLAQAKKPLIILGAQQLKRSDGAALLAAVQQLAKKTAEISKVFNVFRYAYNDIIYYKCRLKIIIINKTLIKIQIIRR